MACFPAVDGGGLRAESRLMPAISGASPIATSGALSTPTSSTGRETIGSTP